MGLKGLLMLKRERGKCNLKYLVVISSLWYEDTSMWRFFLTQPHDLSDLACRLMKPLGPKKVSSIASTPAHKYLSHQWQKDLLTIIMSFVSQIEVVCVCVSVSEWVSVCVCERERERERESEREREGGGGGGAVLNFWLRIELKSYFWPPNTIKIHASYFYGNYNLDADYIINTIIIPFMFSGRDCWFQSTDNFKMIKSMFKI